MLLMIILLLSWIIVDIEVVGSIIRKRGVHIPPIVLRVSEKGFRILEEWVRVEYVRKLVGIRVVLVILGVLNVDIRSKSKRGRLGLSVKK